MTPLLEIVTWGGFIGWQGCTCHKCKATHNLLAGIPGFRCNKCKAFNCLSFSHYEKCHRKPDYGWNRSVLNWAVRNFGWYRDYLKRVDKLVAQLV